MQMTEVTQHYVDGQVRVRKSYSGPAHFTCNGDPATLMASYSIWAPAPVFEYPMPYGGKITIQGRFSE